MLKRNRYKYMGIVCFTLICAACRVPVLESKKENRNLPPGFGTGSSADTANTAKVKWKEFFSDHYLQTLIDTALSNNQELNITLQEIEISRNEIRARKGEYLPSVGIRVGAGVDKVGRYTSRGAAEAASEIKPGKEVPEPLQDYLVAFQASWEVDVWKRLRNAKKAAVSRYLASVEGKNFMLSHLIAEIASSYYELLALDNQLRIVRQNIEIQEKALKIVRLQMEAARETQLAVRRFEAQLLYTQKLQFGIRQQITEAENRINYLLGRYPQVVPRASGDLQSVVPRIVKVGIPSQLLENRPDVRQAELELAAAKLDIKVAKARFYPSLGISGSVGYQAFNPSYLIKSPESVLYSLGAELSAPLINRNAIKATYYNANARQIQAIYDYERTVLNAYIEVANQVSKVDNLQKSYELGSKQVGALSESVETSNKLFGSA